MLIDSSTIYNTIVVVNTEVLYKLIITKIQGHSYLYKFLC